MKLVSIVSLLVVNCIPYSGLYAQASSSDKLTPDAIDQRISEIRMGDIIIQTKPGADVKVQQVRHEFLFGTAVPNSLAETDRRAMSADDREMFLKVLLENFNYAVHENALKWYSCERQPGVVDYSTADRIWDICHELSIPMRGHCIFWEKEEFVMPWVKALNNDDLHAAINRRAVGVTGHFKGRIEEFDLNNEMIHGDFFRRRLGYGIINEMAYLAKQGNPDAVLYLNDYGILDVGGNVEAYIIQIKNLLASGVPIGGIGCQGHLSIPYPVITPVEHIQKTLDKLAQFNLPIKITECNFIFDDEQTRTEQLLKIFPVYFAHPAVEAIIFWGIWEGAHWQPHSALWKKDWSPTPQAQAYRELVFNKWWTQFTGKADAKGAIKTRGFFGDYLITSKGITKKVSLSGTEKLVEVRFD